MTEKMLKSIEPFSKYVYRTEYLNSGTNILSHANETEFEVKRIVIKYTRKI